jgi:hypothetical protein
MVMDGLAATSYHWRILVTDWDLTVNLDVNEVPRKWLMYLVLFYIKCFSMTANSLNYEESCSDITSLRYNF